MNITIKGTRKNIAVIESNNVLISDAQSAIDLAMSVGYETGVYNLLIPQRCIAKDFFILSTQIAGEVLQKYMNYGIRLAIVGDFSQYTSKPLRDFIYESNNGKNFFFVTSEGEAIEKLENILCKERE